MAPKRKNDRASKPKSITPEYMCRFVSAATLAYKTERNEDDRHKDVVYQDVVTDIMEKGAQYLLQPQPRDEENPKYLPYRRMIKALLVQASADSGKESGPLENIPADAPFNGEYTQDHFDIIDAYLAKPKNIRIVQISTSTWVRMEPSASWTGSHGELRSISYRISSHR